jgi:hypothetical protein
MAAAGSESVDTGRSVAIAVDAAGPAEQEPRILTDPSMQATHPDTG